MLANRERREWALGLTFIFLVTVIWAGASVLSQYIYEDMAFNQPALLTYICTSLFSLYIPSYIIAARFGWLGAVNPPLKAAPYDVLDDELPATGEFDPESEAPSMVRMGHRELFQLGLVLGPLWFASNYSYNKSLAWTSVSSSTIISSGSGLFTLLFSVMFAGEAYSHVKVIGVACIIGSSVLVAAGDEDDEGRGSAPVLGDLAALASCVLYAAYTTVLKIRAPCDEATTMPLLLGYVGLINVLFLLLPVCFIVASSGNLPVVSWGLVGAVVSKGLLDNVVSDLLWARAVLLTTPTVATVGLSLTIPLAFASDFMLHGLVPGLLELLASLGVLGGFVLVSAEGIEGVMDMLKIPVPRWFHWLAGRPEGGEAVSERELFVRHGP
ncbi:unnamed protein product [Chrysoparadoxa australica]